MHSLLCIGISSCLSTCPFVETLYRHIEDISERLGVAPSTVSRALNGKPGVSDNVRTQILRTASELGYFQDASDKAITVSKRNIAMIIGDIRNPFYAELVFAVQKTLSAYGYMVSVFNSEYEEEQEHRYMQMLEQFQFDGIIEVCVSAEKISNQLSELHMPIVMVNRVLPGFDTDVVLLDNYEAGYIATRYLLEHGHSRIGFLLGQRTSSSSMKRYEGYLQMMRNYNIPVIEEYQLAGDLTMETGYRVAEKAFEEWKQPPTAMVISNDLAAFGFMAYCRKANVDIPGDISVISFDNTSLSSILIPPLTTIDAHVEEMGRKAAELMMERINYPNAPRKRMILNPTLIERNTVARLPI